MLDCCRSWLSADTVCKQAGAFTAVKPRLFSNFDGLLQGIYAYCTLTADTEPSDELKKELVMSVRSQIGAFAAPDVIHWAPGLPKTRSGKIMRRVLR